MLVSMILELVFVQLYFIRTFAGMIGVALVAGITRRKKKIVQVDLCLCKM
jgi:hypothetical protein